MHKLNLIVFTKHFQRLDIDEIIEAIKSVNANGVDLCVRPGYSITPENALEKLPQAAKRFRDAGLSIPLITAPGDFVNSKANFSKNLFKASKEAGVKLIKLGYWFMEKEGYWKTVEKIRIQLQDFTKLAQKYEVKVLIHNHSGGTMGLNSSSVMNLVKGFDPRYVGIFTDVGHLSLVGEPLAMALDIVKEYMAAIAVKDIVRERVIVDGKRNWQLRVVPLGEGFVDWHTLAKLVLKMKFAGPISMHSEYAELDVNGIIDQTRMDIRFFRKLISESEG